MHKKCLREWERNMPCYGGPSEPEVSISQSRYEDFEFQKALLCASLTFISNSHLLDDFFTSETKLDWNEVGIDPEKARKWWDLHLKEDSLRKKQESIEREKKQMREKALKKLTKEEKKLLGLK